MKLVKRLHGRMTAFRNDESGLAMMEALVSVPFLMIFTLGMLEFGSVLWQRQQIETGLYDAARYYARCGHEDAVCEAAASNLAYHSSIVVTNRHRVPEWNAGTSPILFSEIDRGTHTSVIASTTHQLSESPLFDLLGIGNLTISSSHEQRDIGW